MAKKRLWQNFGYKILLRENIKTKLFKETFWEHETIWKRYFSKKISRKNIRWKNKMSNK